MGDEVKAEDVDINVVELTESSVKKKSDIQADAQQGNEDSEPSHSVEETGIPTVDGIACTLAPASSYITTDRFGAVKIRFGSEKDNVKSQPAISVMEFFDRSVKKFGQRTAMKVEREGNWISWTYNEYLQELRTTAKAFIKLGLEAYNGVGIIGFNSPEWLFSDLGAIFAGGFATGIYTTNNPEACRYVCANAACNVVVAENDTQVQKIVQVWDQLPNLKAIVQYTGEINDKKPNMYTWNELMEIGRQENDDLLEERIKAQSPNKCCTLIYTSGTTGDPKGVMLSHDNIISQVNGSIEHFGKHLDPNDMSFQQSGISYLPLSHIAAQVIRACEGVAIRLRPLVDADALNTQETCISYLPLSHIAAQMTDIWIPIRAGACVWFAKPDALKGSLPDTLRAARPTLFVGVPRVFEKMEEKLKGIGANIHGMKRKLADWAKGIGLRGNRNRETGKPVPYGWTLANGLVLKRIRKALGLDRCKMVFTAAAPISKQTLEYFQSINIPLLEIYGMSEAAGALTLCSPSQSRLTSIGTILPVNEYKIGNPDNDGSGELCFRGRNVLMGYLDNPEKTKETFDDEEYLMSGDVGKIDEDGFFYITGRIKELIITAGGENIAPVPIEDNIKAECPLISTAMVIGDKKKFLSCLLTCQVEIDIDTGLPTDQLLPSAVHYCTELGLNVTKAQEVAPDAPEVLSKAIQEAINNANKKAVSNASRVQKWKLLPLDFTTAGGELGPTQKLRRPHVMKMYKETIDEFYA